MNWINRFFLAILLAPKGFYRKLGVDLNQLRSILSYKLIMDDRRPNSIHQTQKRKQEKPIRQATLGTMLYSMIIGAFFLVGFALGKDDGTKFTIYYSMYIFILISILIADFTSVLIDVRDNLIILPKPINDKTFVLARLLHIVIHVSKMVIPMTLPGLILVMVMYGIRGTIPFIVLVPFITLLTIFLINAIYILILKLTTPEKFKTIISYFQIFFGIFIYASYQLVPRLVDKSVLTGYSIHSLSLAWLLPPYWFAGSWEYLYRGVLASPLFIYFLTSLIAPILSIILVIRYFAPSFNQKLSMISGSEGSQVATSSKQITSTTSGYLRFLSRFFSEKGAERMSFLQTWKITSRSRDFKMKVYPGIGYLFVYIFLMFINNRKFSLAGIQDQSKSSSKFLFLGIIYFSSLVLIMAMYQLIYSEKYKASWIYYVTPITHPGKLISGAIKSIILKFYIPLVFCITVAGVWVIGIVILPNLLLGLCNQLLITTFLAYLTIKQLPFSARQSIQSKGSNFIRGFISMLIPVMVALGHFMVYGNLILIGIFLILSASASWLMMDALGNKNWAQLQQQQYEG